MNRERELEVLLADSGAPVLVCLESLYRDVAARSSADRVRMVVTTSELEFQTAQRRSASSPASSAIASADTVDMAELLARHARRRRPPPIDARRRRHRVPDLHVGDDRAAEGRDDHAPQRRVQRPDLPGLDRPRRATTSCSASRRCSTSPAWSGTSRSRCSSGRRSC